MNESQTELEQARPRMPSPVWNTPHLAEGAPEPKVDPNEITIYNMR